MKTDKIEGNRAQLSVCLWLLNITGTLPSDAEMVQTLQNHLGRVGCDFIPNAPAAQIQPI